MLDEQEQNECEGLLTEVECLESLKSMESNKSPGSDGLPAEFYKVFWNDLHHYLLYIDLAKPKSGAPGFFILTGCRISENKRLWNCPPFGFPGNCLIMSFSSLPT